MASGGSFQSDSSGFSFGLVIFVDRATWSIKRLRFNWCLRSFRADDAALKKKIIKMLVHVRYVKVNLSVSNVFASQFVQLTDSNSWCMLFGLNCDLTNISL